MSTIPSDEIVSVATRARLIQYGIASVVMQTADEDSEHDRLARIDRRLTQSVIRPLQECLDRLVTGGVAKSIEQFAPMTFNSDAAAPPTAGEPNAISNMMDDLDRLASDATMLAARAELPTEMIEAAAALQDLACQLTPEDMQGRTIARFRDIQSSLRRRIQTQSNGPYLVTNVDNVANWLGERLPSRPQMALCRCGRSMLKPFCDGTHADIKFTDEKVPDRVPDRQDTYVGLQVTVLDNRGTCAHSGFCTDRLASVFRLGQEPFVAPSGARLDEIVRAVRACPSGALSYAIDGREARAGVDSVREPTIEVSKDGPYRVTGAIPLVNAQGEPNPRNQGASLEHYSLCRCGHSKNKPFCSGMHWYANFHDPVVDPDHVPTLFEWAGGLPALTLMTRIFYSKYVPDDALLSPLFANMAPDHPERVARWLGEVFGGPKIYSELHGGYPRMISQHVGKGFNEAQRARWVTLLCQSANDAGLPVDPEFRAAFVAYLEWGSRLAVENSQRESKPPLHMPVPRWWWVCDATPGSRISALAPQPESVQQPITLPSKDQPV